jgi:hypothetical protein
MAGCGGNDDSDGGQAYTSLSGTWNYRVNSLNVTYWEEGQMVLTATGPNTFSASKTVAASSDGDTGPTPGAGTVTQTGTGFIWATGAGENAPTISGTVNDTYNTMSGTWATPSGRAGTFNAFR